MEKDRAFGRNILYSESFWKDAGGQDNRDGNAGRRTGMTLDLRKEEGRKNCYRKALELKEKGADIIVLACTGLGMDGIDREIESRTGIHVINPVLAEGLFIFYESLRCRG